MEVLKRQRTRERAAFTKTYNLCSERVGQYKNKQVQFSEVSSIYDLLQDKYDDLQSTSKKVLNEMYADEGYTDQMIDQEITDADKYKENYFIAKNTLQELKQSIGTIAAPAMPRADTVSASQQSDAKKTFKLPKIEFVKFSGTIREWLPFWSVYKEVHNDEDIAKEKKFQLLKQAMVEGSRAEILVRSYPPTADNYDKVIDSLKSRFGRDGLQIEVYIRDLLQLVLSNASKTSADMTLSALYDKLESHMRALESLGVTREKFAAVLFPMVESLLPTDLLRIWQRTNIGQDGQNTGDTLAEYEQRLDRLVKFIEAEVQNEARNSLAAEGFGLLKEENNVKTKKPKTPSNKDIASAAGLIAGSEKKVYECIFCGVKEHASAHCEKAKRMSLQERKDKVKSKRVCFKCLKPNHGYLQCRSRVKCEKCKRQHATIMCFSDGTDENKKVITEASAANLDKDPAVLMMTLRAYLENNGEKKLVRVIFDTGSAKSYVTKEAAAQMRYKSVGEQKINHLIFGGGRLSAVDHKIYKVRLLSLDNEFVINFNAYDQETICETLQMVDSGQWKNELKNQNINLTDYQDKAEPFQVLIGADVVGHILTGRIIQLPSKITAVETRLGWAVMGKVPNNKTEESAAVTAMSLYVQNTDIKGLWELEALGIEDPIAHKNKVQEEKEMKRKFLDTVKFENGRYEVLLPWKENHPPLGDNKAIASSRLVGLKKKLSREGYYDKYDAVFKQWLDAGIIERVPEEEEDVWGHYLPHRHVIKENSSTALRPVFDASSKEPTTPSLNDCLQKGPNLIEQVASIILRFRTGNVGVISDVEKAFLQISISPYERDFLRFLWYDNKGKIIVMRHCRVVFGVCSSPFVLGAIIEYHLQKIADLLNNNINDKLKKENVIKLMQSLYVDNCVTSVNSMNELNEFKEEAISVMQLAGFNLRGWEWSKDGSKEPHTGVLGILWDKNNDNLALNLKNLEGFNLEKITKRSMLSVTHRIFDPLGISCPITLAPRVLLQEVCLNECSWDEKVDEKVELKFIKWYEELKDLSKIQIPRCMIGNFSEIDDISLHVFCDASKIAYATVIFLRIQQGNEVKLSFIQAKSRVSPLKNKEVKHSIPRLELLAATIGSRLSSSILNVLNCNKIETYYWSDSSCVLAWIHRENNWGTFVFNRVKEIRQLSCYKQWRHVPGPLNPADLPSRGCTVGQLLSSKWWEGPEWLRKGQADWPKNVYESDESEINKELRKTPIKIPIATFMNLLNFKSNSLQLDKYSSFRTLVRVVGWIKRFFHNSKMKNKKERRIGELLRKEFFDSEKSILKIIQKENFTGTDDESIRHLEPFVDRDGLIRIKTKILLREDNFNFKCPIVIPRDNFVTNLIILETHTEKNHADQNALMTILREKYWVIGGRKTLRKATNKCIECKIADKAKAASAPPAPLPIDRVRDAAVFEIIGVDLTGPVYLKEGGKAWICIFTCAVFRAVHFELINALNIFAFLMALRRHIARRGRPSVIFSDNGTNFRGTNRLLKKLKNENMPHEFKSIEWKFNPPTASWWGGFWERLIGVLKKLLKRSLGKECLTYEQMITVLTDCEAVINSRPITFMSDSSNEIEPLTPAHFIQEIKEIGVLDLDQIEKTKLNKRYTHQLKIKNDLRQRFRSEYLGALAHYNKNRKNMKSVKLNDIVLIGNDKTKRIQWPLARVTDLYRGKDGIIRVAKLITLKKKVLVRPIQRLFPLEIGEQNVENENFNIKNDNELNVIENDMSTNDKINDKNDFENAKVDSSEVCQEINESVLNEVVTRSGRKIVKPQRLNYY